MAGFLLDTNHLSDAISRVSRIRDRIQQTHHQGVRIGTCINVICELEAGIQNLNKPDSYRRRLANILKVARLWSIDLGIAHLYGEIHSELEKKGRMLSHVDILLAALARQLDLTVLTTDRDFEALPDIKTENWLA